MAFLRCASVLCLAALFAGRAGAYTFECSAEGGIWSKIGWTGAGGGGALPGLADTVKIRGPVSLDRDVKIRELLLQSPTELALDGRKAVVTGRANVNVVDSAIVLKNGASLDFEKNFEISKHPGGTREIKRMEISLEDSVFSAGSFAVTMRNANLNTELDRGVLISLAGASVFTVKSALTLDDLFRLGPGKLFFKFRAVEKGGKLPSVKIGYADFRGLALEAQLGGSTKKGAFPLIVYSDKNPDFSAMRLFINSRPCALGEKAAAGKFQAWFEAGKSGKDAALILHIK